MFGHSEEPEFDLLFWKARGYDARQRKINAALQQVDRVSAESLLRDPTEQLIKEIVADHSVTVPALQRENTEFERRDRNVRRMNDWGQAVQGMVPTYYFETPFTGDAEIFQLQPNTHNMSPPRGAVRGNSLIISVVGTEDPARIKQEAEATLNSVEEYLGWHQQLWANFADELARQIQSRVSQRIQQAKEASATKSGLEGFGFKAKR